MSTYLFYDLETTGLNKCFDQVIQFAAVRTDMKFNELERYSTFVKLRPDVIYAPGAIITNRISICESMSGLCEYEAIRKIHRLFNQPETISIGYNSLKFDDEFLRFSFHKNLLPPYTHQYNNGCYRMDLLPITTCYYLYKNDALKWAKVNGQPTMKLEYLNIANKLAAGKAHNALVDVEATVELARRLSKEGDMWTYLTGYFNKKEDVKRVSSLPPFFDSGKEKHKWGLMIGTRYGPDQAYQIPLLYLGDSVPYSNQTIWLRLDSPGLRDARIGEIAEKTSIVRKRYGEAEFMLPPEGRFMNHLPDERLAVIEENRKWLQKNDYILDEIINYYCQYEYPFIPELDADAALYQMGFPDSVDEGLCRSFYSALLEDKSKLIGQFKKQEFNVLAERILCRNYPSISPPESVTKFHRYIKKHRHNNQHPLLDFKGEAQGSFKDVLEEIIMTRKEHILDDEQKELLDELENYVTSKLNVP